MKFLHKCITAIILLFILCFSGCSFDSKYDAEFFAMDTVMTITAYGSNSTAAVSSAENEINRLDALLSVKNKNSEVYKLNADKSVKASDDMLALLNCASEAYDLTNGAFDITTEPLTKAWGFYSDLENRVPSQKEIEKALRLVGFDNIKTNKNVITLDGGATVDFGGIAKGYASAKAAKIIENNGVSSALISLGGNVRAVGSRPDGSDWSVAIVNPDDTSRRAGVLRLSDKAVVTSGGYQRNFEENGKIYHHIIDPRTGYPAQSGLKSVTVVSQDDCLADAMSTALFVLGLEESSKICLENSDTFGAVFITDKNKIYVTDNLKNCFNSESGFEVIA